MAYRRDDKLSDEIARTCILTRTRQISRVVTSTYDQELRPFGLNSSQFTLLALISRLGPIGRSDLGRSNHQDRTTLTRNLQPLMLQGWVEEEFTEKDRRSKLLRLTGEGHSLLQRATPAWRAAQLQAKDLLGVSGSEAIMDMAEGLRQADD